MLSSLDPICLNFIETAKEKIFSIFEKIIEKNFSEFPKMQNEVVEIIQELYENQH